MCSPLQGPGQGQYVELRDYLEFVRRRWWLLVLGAAIAGAAAFVVSQQLPRVYRAHATILVSQAPALVAGETQSRDRLDGERLTNTYAELVERGPVFAAVIQRLGLAMSQRELNDKISVTAIEGTQLLRVSAQDADPARAALLANTMVTAFIDDHASLPERPGAVSIATEAEVPDSPVSPDTVLNTAVAIVLGLLIAGCVGLAIDYLDDTVKTPGNVESLTGLSTLGLIRRFRAGSDGETQSVTSRVASPYGEDYRELRTYVQFARLESDLKTVLVVSDHSHEGRSTTAASLAVVFAQTGDEVILIDADLRRPTLHRIFDTRNALGLAGVLLRDVEPDEALVATGVDKLRLMPSGPQPPNPSELLTSNRMSRVLEVLRDKADFIIIDSPPMSAVTDASILAGRVDGTLIVVEAGRTRSDVLRNLVQSLRQAKAHMIGVVLNKVKSGRRDYGFYGHHEAPPDIVVAPQSSRLPGAARPRG